MKYDHGPIRTYYGRLEKDKAAERRKLRQYENKVDVETYRPILMEVLALFGVSIHASLERTMGSYLKATDGAYRNKFRDDRQLGKMAALLCSNNSAERPFAIAKAYLNMYQSMSLCTLAGFSLSICNGSHSPDGASGKQRRTKDKVPREAGGALSADPIVQLAVTKLCSVKKAKNGKVTLMLDNVLMQTPYERLHAVNECALKRKRKRFERMQRKE
jgi:hypothetical protein